MKDLRDLGFRGSISDLLCCHQKANDAFSPTVSLWRQSGVHRAFPTVERRCCVIIFAGGVLWTSPNLLGDMRPREVTYDPRHTAIVNQVLEPTLVSSLLFLRHSMPPSLFLTPVG